MKKLNNNISNLLYQLSFDENEEIIHEINQEVFNEELYIILNNENIITLTTDNDDYLIPVFSNLHSLNQALDELSKNEFEIDLATGEELLSLYIGDENFLGLAINPPEFDHILFSDEVESIV